MTKEFQALGLDITVLNEEGKFVDLKELEASDEDSYLSTNEFETTEDLPVDDEIVEDEEDEFDDFDDIEDAPIEELEAMEGAED